MRDDRLLTLDDNPPFRPEQILEVPKYDFLISNGKQETWDIPSDLSFADGRAVNPFKRTAEEGERIMDVDLKYITDPTENIKFRAQIRHAANHNAKLQKMHMDLCRSSVVYFFNAWCWTFHPGKQSVPFILYPFQEEIAEWLVWVRKTHQTALIEKSRKQGLSWLLIGFEVWLSLFHENEISFAMSMTEKEVDNRLKGSLLGKVRFLISHLPWWMRQGWREFAVGIDQKMNVNFPDNGSLIEGVLTGGNAGRSDRANFILYDEFAHVQDDTETLEASSTLSDAELFLSTVKGMDNEFAKMAHDSRVVKMSIHWRENPTLNEKWAIKERAKVKYTKEKWAQEMDIAYTTSTSGRVFNNLISTTDGINPWVHIQEANYFDFDPAFPVDIGIDFGFADPNSVVFTQTKPCVDYFDNIFGNILIVFEDYEKTNQLTSKLCDVLLEKGDSFRYRYIVGDRYSADQTEKVYGAKIINYMHSRGLNLVGNRNSQDAPIDAVRQRLEVPGAMVIHPRCTRLIKGMQNWAYPVDKHTQLPRPGSKPNHDTNSHICKAICYLIDYLPKRIERKTTQDIDWDFRRSRKLYI